MASQYNNMRAGSHKYKQHGGSKFISVCCPSPPKETLLEGKYS